MGLRTMKSGKEDWEKAEKKKPEREKQEYERTK